MPATKGQKYNITPKPKIKEVFDKVVNNGQTVGEAVKEVYNSKRNTTVITKSKSWEVLLQKHIPDSKLARVLSEGLEATKIQGIADAADGDEIEVPDFPTRHKYLETGLKLKNRFPKENPDNPLDGDLKVLLVQINNVINAKG